MREFSLIVAVFVMAGFAVPAAFAQNATSTKPLKPQILLPRKPTSTPERKPTSTVPKKEDIDFACVKRAVEKRDSAIGSAFDAFHSSAASALKARRDALSIAWGGPTVSKDAVKTAWDAYKAAAKRAREAMKKAQKDAWAAHKTDLKACRGGSSVTEPGGGEGADANL